MGSSFVSDDHQCGEDGQGDQTDQYDDNSPEDN